MSDLAAWRCWKANLQQCSTTARVLALTCTLLGGIACGGAVYAGWVKPEQLDKVVDEAKQRADAFGRMFSAAADAVPSKVKESKVSTMYKKAPGLVLGGAAGFMLGYKLG